VLHNHFYLLHDASLHDVRCDDTLSDDGSGNGYDSVYAIYACVYDMYDTPSTSDYDNNLDRNPNTNPNDTPHKSESKTNQKSQVSPHILAQSRSYHHIYRDYPLSSPLPMSHSLPLLSQLPHLEIDCRQSQLESPPNVFLSLPLPPL
jgi:hypothetical protein